MILAGKGTLHLVSLSSSLPLSSPEGDGGLADTPLDLHQSDLNSTAHIEPSIQVMLPSSAYSSTQTTS